ncbi:MAG: flagellar biosynthesis protein FlhA [Phycisphaerales bacterium]|jgi:flagellar biosynthesis protein FlhA|nr:flagellar biosynthesis protein FlhA [Phycisphaerales bacterium]
MKDDMKGAKLDGPTSAGLGWFLAHNDIVFAFGLMVVLTTLLIPLPTFMLDIMLSCSIAIALATLLVVLATKESIELSSFPSLLLFVTLFRLSMNVASTRLILTQGDAGAIIETFGNLVAQGSLIIGLVVFLILVIIQFVVITKGAERISEVAARFNLDAMPGKQMAIDADLNAGIIGAEEAGERRRKVASESEFYGAMDGASKFVRGDAIAGLIITAVNLVGGFAVGMTEGLTAGESIKTYSVLAIGDGLVSQIPAIIISTASGFLISKANSTNSLSHDMVHQMLARGRPLGIAAVVLGLMVFVPGFPKLPLVGLALGMGLLARTLNRSEAQPAETKPEDTSEEAKEPPVTDLLDVDRLAIQVGARLIKLVDPRQKNSLSHRIAPLRRRFAKEYGIVLPLVRLRDNIALEPNTYEIRLHDHVIGTGELEPQKFMAMDPGTVTQEIAGQSAEEPVFNLPAIWVDAEQKSQAELNGYTVVDPESVLVTHLSEALKRHACELLSRDDTQELVERLRQKHATLINEVIGDLVPMGLLHRVLQNLLRDNIPIRDMTQIIEALGDHAGRTKEPGMLTELTRKALVRTITERSLDADSNIWSIVLAPSLEYELCNSLGNGPDGETLNLPPEKVLELAREVVEGWRTAVGNGHDQVVLLCDRRLRPHLASLLSRQLPQLPIVAYDEIVPGTQIESAVTVNLESENLVPAGAAR